MAATVILPSHASAYTHKQSEQGYTLGWRNAIVPLRLHPATAHLVTSDVELLFAMEEATTAWGALNTAATMVPELMVVEGHPGEQGYHVGVNHNGVYYQSPWELDVVRLAVTITTYQEPDGVLLDTDIVINGDFQWTTTACASGWEPSYDLPAVMAHEFGHVLGLGESDVQGATMWPTIGMCDGGPRDLSEDDVAGVTKIYEDVEMQQPAGGCGGSTVASRSAVPPWLWAGLFLIGTAYLLWRRTQLPLSPVRRNATGVVMGLAVVVNLPILGTAGDSHGERAPQASAAEQHGHQGAEAARLAQLLRNAEDVFIGTATRLDVEWRGGILWTRYRVEQPDGSEVELELPGGRTGEIVQQVGEEPAPTDGDTMVVAPQTDGRMGWALVQTDGALRGGWLGHGSAIDVL